MKVICDRAALLSALNLVAGVVPSRSPKPQLTCIRFTARKGEKGAPAQITLSATDAEISVRLARTQVDVQEGGEVLFPADRMRAIVSAEDSEPTLTLESDQDICHIKGRDARFKIYGYPVGDFPPIPEFPSGDTSADVFSLTAGALQQLIGRTVFSTARENSRYAINGVLLKRTGKKLEMVATDGRRLALARGSLESASGGGDKTGSCIVPTKALSLVQKLIEHPQGIIRVAVTANQILFAVEGDPAEKGAAASVLASNLVEGSFPPYEEVIPKDQDKRAKFDVQVLSSAVRRAALLTNEESRGVKLAFAGGAGGGAGGESLRMSSRAPEMGEAEIDVELESYEGGDIEIGFNPQFLSDALKVVAEESVILELKAPNKPGLIKSGADFLYVVMPVNLQ